MTVDSDIDLSGYFETGRECSVLGMELACDPARAHAILPSIPAARRPHVFVVSPGPLVESLGIANIMADDVLYAIGGGPARYREMVVDSIPTFVNALTAMHSPFEPTQLCWIAGRNRDGGIQKGTTRYGAIHVPEAELPGLRVLRDGLRGYARSARLPWREVRRHYAGGPYSLHVLWQNVRARVLQPRKKEGMCPVTDLPVHRQYVGELLLEMCRRAPCSITLKRNGRNAAALQVENASGIEPPLAEVMEQRQVGSSFWLFRYLRHFRATEVSVGRNTPPFDCSIEKERDRSLRISVTKSNRRPD